MRETHTFTCDFCGQEDQVFCDGRGPAKVPAGWVQRDDGDYCEECARGAAEEEAAGR